MARSMITLLDNGEHFCTYKNGLHFWEVKDGMVVEVPAPDPIGDWTLDTTEEVLKKGSEE